MYLKRLDIKGFKSFADKTEIELGPGINVIVGPNGCGKSNVVDAIRWVLGEANVRNLRGQKSEDVIFAGTDKERSQGLALVEMTLDNSDNVLPVNYNEVTVARKIFRSGESEFAINRTRVRMKDINELFSGTGLGKKGYSIINQGELELVLNGQAIDRRLMLEEAANIFRYRQQRDEVNRRLGNSQQDLLRLADLMAELEQRCDELKIKADKARQWLDLSREHQQKEQAVFCFERSRLQRETDRKQEDFTGRQKELSSLKNDIDLLRDQLLQDETNLRESELKLQELKDEQSILEREISNLRGELGVTAERLQNRKERITTAEDDANKYSQMLENLVQDLAAQEHEWDDEIQAYQVKSQEYSNIQAETAELKNLITRCRQEFETQKGIVFGLVQEESRVRNTLSAVKGHIEKLQEKKARLSYRIEDGKNKLEQLKNRLDELETKHQEAASCMDELLNQKGDLEKQRQIKLQESAAYETRLRQIEEEAVQTRQHLLALAELQKNYSGYSPGVKAVLSAAGKKELPGIMGVAGEVIDVPPGLEFALEVAVGRGLENIIVEKVDYAQQAIEYLKNHGLGRVTFLPLDILKASAPPEKAVKEICGHRGVLGLASRLVNCEKRFQPAIDFLLGRVVVVEGLQAGIDLFRELSYPIKIVSLEGDLINPGGAVSGGSKPKNDGTRPLQRKGEQKRLLVLQEENQQKQQEYRKNCEIIRKEIKDIDLQGEELARRIMENEYYQELLAKEKDHLLCEMYNNRDGVQEYLQQLAGLEQEIIDSKQECNALLGREEELASNSEEAGRNLEALRENKEKCERELALSQERLLSMQEQLTMKKRELDNHAKNIEQFKQVQRSYEESYQEAVELGQRLREEMQAESARLNKLQTAMVEKEKLLENHKAAITSLRNLLLEYRKAVREKQENLEPLETKSEELFSLIRSLEIAITRLDMELDALDQRWKEKFRTPWPTDITLPSHPQIRETKIRVEQLHDLLEQMGPVDLEAISEYETQYDRFVFVNKQYQDLTAARDSLSSLLTETEKLMLKNFARFLTLANESFNRTFQEIFGGGEAALRVEEGKERLEAGIEIQVKLPGKKNQDLNLLSGGERALTCIAFIFSLFRLNPAPFCLFDEVDAALDDANLARFNHFIKEMSGSMQFIIISHRQATIEIGERVYGVTMPEKGISKVFSLEMGQIDSIAG